MSLLPAIAAGALCLGSVAMLLRELRREAPSIRAALGKRPIPRPPAYVLPQDERLVQEAIQRLRDDGII